jgi:hypothetical protein
MQGEGVWVNWRNADFSDYGRLDMARPSHTKITPAKSISSSQPGGPPCWTRPVAFGLIDTNHTCRVTLLQLSSEGPTKGQLSIAFASVVCTSIFSFVSASLDRTSTTCICLEHMHSTTFFCHHIC